VTKADIVVKADYVLKMDRDLTLIRNGAIAVKDKKIVWVGPAEEVAEKYTSDTIIGGEGKVAFPGLVNTHTHAAMVYFRGLADDLPLKVWLEEHIWPAEEKWLSPEFVGDAVELACLEMLKAGITVYNDMYFFGDAIAKATKRAGMRAVVGVGILDLPSKSARTTEEYFVNAESFVGSWKGDELITPCIAPHAPYTCGPETLRKAKALAEKSGLPLHIHISETQWEVNEILSAYGKRPVDYLDSLGVLDNTVLAAHCIWLEDNEIELLAKRGVGVSHCMESNLKLASGFAPVAAMLSEGVKVTFGTDGAASNNDLNIFSEMSTTAKVHKALTRIPPSLMQDGFLDGNEVGAEAMDWKRCRQSRGRQGSGYCAADLRKPHLVPFTIFIPTSSMP
jgi:5-methylthioadenosine/S-adenosylhomocysteine deaminase